MATNDPKKRSIAGKLVENKLTERPDDFTFNVTYLGSRSIDDLCSIAAKGKSKFTASELRSAYEDLKAVAKDELYSASTVEFGFAYNSLGVEGAFIGPKAQFKQGTNRVIIRFAPLAELRPDLDSISVIVGEVQEGLPTIVTVTDVFTKEVNNHITPGNTLIGTGSRTKIVGEASNNVGFFFVDATDETKVTPMPETSISRNEPSNFSFIIPSLAKGKYYLEVATRYGGNSKQLLKEVRRNRFPYLLTVGNDDSDHPVIE